MVKYRDENEVSLPIAATSGRSTPASAFSDDVLLDYGFNFDEDDGNMSGEISVEDEFAKYANATLSKSTQGILQFWTVRAELDFYLLTHSSSQANAEEYPNIYKIAMDYLPIQASAVPCERVFSSSAETDTKRRNCIKPILMEALQIIKYRRKKARINLMSDWRETVEKVKLDERMKGNVDDPESSTSSNKALSTLLLDSSEDKFKTVMAAIDDEDKLFEDM
jgi:hypothetical protein